MTASDQIETATRNRTRVAILDAAMTLFGADPGAPLSAVATAAGVGRSTLHRYFPERDDLTLALLRHVHAASNAAIAAAHPDLGPPLPALRRVIEGQFELGPILNSTYNDPRVRSDPELRRELELGDEAVAAALSRAAGPERGLPPGWSRRVFWAMLVAGWEAEDLDRVPRPLVIDAIITTLTSGLLTADTEQRAPAEP